MSFLEGAKHALVPRALRAAPVLDLVPGGIDDPAWTRSAPGPTLARVTVLPQERAAGVRAPSTY